MADENVVVATKKSGYYDANGAFVESTGIINSGTNALTGLIDSQKALVGTDKTLSTVLTVGATTAVCAKLFQNTWNPLEAYKRAPKKI